MRETNRSFTEDVARLGCFVRFRRVLCASELDRDYPFSLDQILKVFFADTSIALVLSLRVEPDYGRSLRFFTRPNSLLDLVCDVEAHLVKRIILFQPERLGDDLPDRVVILAVFTIVSRIYGH